MDVAALRKSSGMSQSKFAEYYGIPVRTLQQWEQGKSSPTPYVLSMMKKLKPAPKSLNDDAGRFKIPERRRWKVCIDDPFENCDRIYPIQQRKVQELIEDITSGHDVERIVVFGSSVTQRCRIDSDVDVYVDAADGTGLIGKSHDFEYDLWTNDTVDERLLREIEDSGVVVYG